MIISSMRMIKEKESLSEFILRMLEQGEMSESDISKRSGGEISQGYINDIKNNRVLPESLTVKKIRALARGLGITEEEMFARVRGIYKQDLGLSVEISNYTGELPSSRQKDLLNIAKLFFRESDRNPEIIQIPHHGELDDEQANKKRRKVA